ncbi:glutaredoxin family protein [Hazenella sp. IB182357]|uniref:Glutaredoxin family protein n=1 Tax=Polycladospora coralii TaxID=2771432 RepID=A0A926RSX0_9BACL|nr:glutaredoxin family protein [Polycladospora coralii]MBD1370858.1 glutaredoxin family protein [Polycladospora coralii]MBS7529797.1 glutaredoxin family protein [Polycladospora coralii]
METIIVYSKPHCIECNVLKRFLNDHQIQYETRDCSLNSAYLEEVKALGFLGVPVTVIKGKAIQGLQPDLILEQINRNQ